MLLFCFLKELDARGRPKARPRDRKPERDSSTCRDVDKDESKMRKPDTQEEKAIKKYYVFPFLECEAVLSATTTL